eukprot:SM000093S24455  [mRNA]  locus=s93:420910:423764:- [translate_table: standard]
MTGQMPNGGGGPEARGARAAVDKGADFANYFCTYAFLYHQKEMLSDRVRMRAYHRAVFANAAAFAGKVVLDVGTGSGILAIWAAQAGARKVYAVEATNMAQHAELLAASNGVSGIVEVIQGSIEDVTLPEKVARLLFRAGAVDVIISEWMGYFLVRESMLDSKRIAVAREVPRIIFLDETSSWQSLYPEQVIGTPAVLKEFDCHKVTLADIERVSAEFSLPLSPQHSTLSGFAGWFDVHFRGSQENPASEVVELSTAPSANETTHWGQQAFVLHPPVQVKGAATVSGIMDIARSKSNHRLMDVKVMYQLDRRPPTECTFFIE